MYFIYNLQIKEKEEVYVDIWILNTDSLASAVSYLENNAVKDPTKLV